METQHIFFQITNGHLFDPLLHFGTNVISKLEIHEDMLSPFKMNVTGVFFFFFFFLILLDTCPFLGPVIPLFRTFGDVSSGFKARVGSALFELCRGVGDICSLRFTSGVTPLPVYIASIAASHFLKRCVFQQR